jgi:DNA-binding winged helix-turn-helix (wHTH) protein
VSVRFGPFELDPAARELRREGWPVRLGPRALELLSLLVAERPRALSKQELAARLWPDTFVSVPTRSSPPSGLAAWGRSTARATRGWAGRSR